MRMRKRSEKRFEALLWALPRATSSLLSTIHIVGKETSRSYYCEVIWRYKNPPHQRL
jgi:hypothetical protein